MKNLKLFIAAAAVFFSLLTFFVFKSGWYPESELVIQGIAPGIGSRFVVLWDSGEGFNRYESERFVLDTGWPDGKPEHTIVIRRTGIQGGGSLNSDVRLYGIRLDRKDEVPLSNLVTNRTTLDNQGLIKFTSPGGEVRFRAAAEHHIQFDFPTNNYSGSVDLEVNGSTRTYDLYTTNSENRKRGDEHTREIDYWILAPDGAFTVFMPLPRYYVKSLVLKFKEEKNPVEFKSISLVSEHYKKSFPVPKTSRGRVVLGHIDPGRKRYWHPNQFVFQVLFSGLTTWIILSLWGMVKKYKSPKHLFIEDGRYLFWILLGGGILTFSVWLVAFWPGVMSVDSLKVWRAARIPGYFLNDHPFLNVLLYRYLMHIWDHPAVVPIAQIILVSLLGAHIFFSLFQKGIRIPILLPFYLLFICSVPVGLYNIVLWKDVPFALLVTFWAYMLSDMFYQKRNRTLSISRQGWIALFLLYISLALVRHNGVLYLLVVPLLMAVTGIISIKQVAIAVVIIAGIMIAGLLTLRFKTSALERHFVLEKASGLFNQIRQGSANKMVTDAALKYFFILNINQKNAKWDLWHSYLQDRHAYGFLKRVGWNDIYPYLKPYQYPFTSLRKIGLKVYKETYKAPWVYLTWNPFYMLGLFLIAIFLFWYLPMSAIFSFFVVIQIVGLLLFFPLNWRYYYFAVFSAYFLMPLMVLDIKERGSG